MKTIYKYPLRIIDFQTVQMPVGAKPISVGIQNEESIPVRNIEIQMWAIINASNKIAFHNIWIVGTGNPIPKTKAPLEFIGTVQMRTVPLVWHVFKEKI